MACSSRAASIWKPQENLRACYGQDRHSDRVDDQVLRVIPLQGHTENELLERAASSEAHSQHPLARAVLRHARAAGLNPLPAENTRVLSGKGVEASGKDGCSG